MTERRRIAILGSTGSIGRQTLEVVRRMPDAFEVVGLASGTYSDAFRSQLAEFRPPLAAVGKPQDERRSDLPPEMLLGQEGLRAIATAGDVDLLVVATVGHAGLGPTLAAAQAGKSIALANKEALVMAGRLVTETARAGGAPILPVDSEHSAIWQCLRGEGDPGEWGRTVESLILTASGGALRDLPVAKLGNVTPAQVLAHPTWKMGPKVTVDSATLMNKGLEVIEARWLFGLPLDRIKVVLHRESVVHSMVQFVDGSVKAQLGPADMRIPIQYALCYPERVFGDTARLDLASVGSLSFGEIDLGRYPCLRLAMRAATMDRSYPAAMSAANEAAVDLFLGGRIPFGAIPELVEDVLARHEAVEPSDLEVILHVDRWARNECLSMAATKGRG